MLNLYFVRHGETDSNVRNTYLGWTDIELNSNGRKQAESARKKMTGIEFDSIYSSPLKRALQTAEIINKTGNMQIKISEMLKERNFGIWDNLTYKEITENYRTEHNLWVNDWVNYCIPGGESAITSYSRTTGFIDNIFSMENKEESKSILIVTHLGCIRNAISHILGMGIKGTWNFRVDNCGISVVQIKEAFPVLTQLNG